MRRKKVSQIYEKTGNLKAVQLLLGHTKMNGTVRSPLSEEVTAIAFFGLVVILWISVGNSELSPRTSQVA